MENFIAHDGEARIHEACEAGHDHKQLAQDKMNWVVEHHTTENVSRFIDRFVAYRQREDDAARQHAEAEAGTEMKKQMLYRKQYYIELNIMMNDYMDQLVGIGFGALNRH